MDLSGPALAAPDGVTANLDNPDNKNGLALFVIILCAVISTICVAVRVYARIIHMKRYKLEEALVICAYIIFWVPQWAAYRMLVVSGYFVHQWDIRISTVIQMTYLLLVMGNAYSCVLCLVKIAMLMDWCSILAPKRTQTNAFFYWSCMAMIAVQALAGSAMVISLNVQCIPREASWDITVAGKCFPLYTIQLSSGIFFLITDVIMIFLPQAPIWKLQLSRQKKIGVSVVFGLGILACVLAAIRLQTTVALNSTTDNTYGIGSLILSSMAEMTCGFFVVCAPTLPVALHAAKRQMGMTTKTKSGQSGASYGYNRSNHAGTKNGGVLSESSRGYVNLGDDGIAMKSMTTESTENLR